MVYPPSIIAILDRLRHTGRNNGNCIGSDANFSCGCVVRVSVDIDAAGHSIRNARFTSNGCGWMVAAAEIVCEFLAGKGLGDLKGLTDREMLSALGTIDLDRSACVNSSISAARRAFADFRSRQIEEFRGEKALICTCFGVTEDRIEASIRESGLQTVAQVGDATNAGTGCGSCRMLIEEMLDGR